MIPQKEAGELQHEQTSPAYGSYQEGQQDGSQHGAIYYEQPPREVPGGKVYPSLLSNKTILQFLWFAVAMVALLAFAGICLIAVGGTAGWISFIVAAFVIMVIAATAVSQLK